MRLDEIATEINEIYARLVQDASRHRALVLELSMRGHHSGFTAKEIIALQNATTEEAMMDWYMDVMEKKTNRDIDLVKALGIKPTKIDVRRL